MGSKKQRHCVFGILFAIVIPLAGWVMWHQLTRPTRADLTPKLATCYLLRNRGAVLVLNLLDNGVQPHDFQSLDHVLTLAREKRLSPQVELNRDYYTDYWGNPFRFELRRDGDVSVIRILSDGYRGQWAHNRDKQLAIDILVPLAGRPVVQPNANCQGPP